MRHKTKRPIADSATILTLWALPDDLWQRIERLLNRFDPPRPRRRKRASARPILDGLIYHFRTGCQWNQIPEVYGDDSTIHRTFQRWVKIPTEKEPQHLCLDAGYDNQMSRETVKEHHYQGHIRPARGKEPTRKSKKKYPPRRWVVDGKSGSRVHLFVLQALDHHLVDLFG